MGIELPAELADIAQRTGTQWPKADEEAMQAQATAWREAAQSLRSLATDADASANGALQGMSGDAGDAARRAWGGFVDPDRGSLTAAARGADQAADRLDHAAKQIGDGKVEIVRQLVDAARNEESARAAADGGHPGALLGVQNLLGAVSTNVASVTDSLVTAVADPASTLDATTQVNAHPGAHGEGSRGGLLNAVSGLTGDVVTSTTDAATGLVDRTTATAGGLVDRTADTAAEAVDQGGRTAGEAVGGASRSVSDALDPGPSAPESSVVPEVVRGAVEEVSPDAPTPPSGLAAGGGASGSFAEAVTPRSGIPIGSSSPAQTPGQTALAGYADAPLPPAGPPPSAAPPLPGAAPPAQPGSAFGPFGGAPAAAPPAAPAPAAPGAPAAGAAPAPREDRAPQRPPAPEAAQRPAPQQPQAQRPAPPAAPPPAPQQPQPEKPPAAQPPMGSPRADRKSVVALFLVHMFPLGHLPRAAVEPARQLPAPAPDVDPISAPRFEPHDHPNSHVFDDAIAMPDRAVDAPGLVPEHPAAAALLDVYDSLAGLHERDWDRRYLVKQDARSTEYAWPPGEVYPEGCLEDGEPVMLPLGTLVDRFGDPHGRVFAADATPYHKRSLPPPATAGEYRRYRVVRELPMWRGIAASWFGQPGSGVRYRSVYPARDLVVLGYIEDITGEAPQAGGTA